MTACNNFRRKNMSQSKIAEMLDHLVNDETDKAEEIFHEYVVEKSREIYENLIESEIEDDEDEAVEEATDEDDEDAVEEAADQDDDQVDENFEDLEVDEGEDETDDFMGDVEADDEEDEEGSDEEDEEGSDEPATKDDVMDLRDAIDDLEAAFREYTAGEEGEEGEEGEMDMDMDMDMDEPKMDAFDPVADLETVREYVEKVDGHGAEKKGKAENADNKHSPVAGKNDMGGTTANIAKGGEGGGKADGFTGKPKDMNTGNINVVGGTKTSSMMSKNGKGHGAEKSGTGEGSTDSTSIIGSK